MIRLATLLVGVLLVGGCSAVAPDVPLPAGAHTTGSAPTVIAAADPTTITIPKIGVHSTLDRLGLTPDGALQTPPVDDPLQAGWYAGAKPTVDGDEIKPGQIGPAVIVGHVDGVIGGKKGQPGVFYRLRELVAGDVVLVDRDGGSQLKFVVVASATFPKDAFPTDTVYGPTDDPELRLITCTGPFDHAAHSYVDNLVVSAALAS